MVIRHTDGWPAGSVGTWLAEQGLVPRTLLAGPDAVGPDAVGPDAVGEPGVGGLGQGRLLDGAELLVVLGTFADVSAADDTVAWVRAERRLIERALRLDVPVLGICFGAQLLARALGAEIRRAPTPELGWRSVGSRRPDLVPDGPWLQWHTDVFDVPPDASELARNAFGSQAFAYGPHLGLQFHPEITAETLTAWTPPPSPVVVPVGADPLRLADRAAEDWAATDRDVRFLLDVWRTSHQPRAAPLMA